MRGAELACKAVTWESSLRLACWLGSTMSSTWLRPEQATRSAATQHAFSGRRTPTRRYTVHCTNQRCHGRPRQTWRGANNGRKRATHADSLARQHGMDCISLAGSIAGRLQSCATALPALWQVRPRSRTKRVQSRISILAFEVELVVVDGQLHWDAEVAGRCPERRACGCFCARGPWLRCYRCCCFGYLCCFIAVAAIAGVQHRNTVLRSPGLRCDRWMLCCCCHCDLH
jgi:hypothetical protein